MARAFSWWRPDVYADRRPFLAVRMRIRRAVADWFEAQGFVEVETAALQVSPGNEAHLHALRTELLAPDGAAATRYLHTSPEFACKKLLAAGERRLFTFARVFRNREQGPLHHPEFTMLEWYRAGQPYETLMEDCAALLRVATEAAGSARLAHGGRSADPALAPERVSVADACRRFAGIDLAATLAADEPDRDGLARQAMAAGIRIAPDDTWGDIFSRILVQCVEPQLGNGRATILDAYPAASAALARRLPRDPRFAERFELFAAGVELVNAFGELTDSAEQRRRLDAEMAEKARVYGERYPIDEEFLAALDTMPPASGAALGFDRLVMLATDAARIEQVLWTPVTPPSGDAP
jgi:lysyl-tRNA synthetase class 2